MPKYGLCDYADAYIPIKGIIAITGKGDTDAAKQLDGRNNREVFKNQAPFTKCISIINGKETDNAQDISIAMPSII